MLYEITLFILGAAVGVILTFFGMLDYMGSQTRELKAYKKRVESLRWFREKMNVRIFHWRKATSSKYGCTAVSLPKDDILEMWEEYDRIRYK